MHGVYKYEVGGEVIYVGKTDSDFAARIACHDREDSFLPYLPDAKIFVHETKDAREADFLETLLINQHSPVLNKAKKDVTEANVWAEMEWQLWDKRIQHRPKEPGASRSRHLHILTHESIVDRMDAYAAKHGYTRVAVFEAAVTAYLDQVDPEEQIAPTRL